MQTDKQLLRVSEVAKILELGISSVWRLARKGQIPAPIRIGGSTRWRRADIEGLTAREAQ
jgi:excisionase family DNA binding protein